MHSRRTGLLPLVAVVVTVLLGLFVMPILANPNSYVCSARYAQAKANAISKAKFEGKSQADIDSIMAALDIQQQQDQECKTTPSSTPEPTNSTANPTVDPTISPTFDPTVNPTTNPTVDPPAPVPGQWYHWYTTDPGKLNEFNFGPPAQQDTEAAVAQFREAIRKDPSQTCVHYQTKVESKWPLNVAQYNQCVRELMGDQAKAERMAQEIDDSVESYVMEDRRPRRVDTYTMVMVDGVPHVLTYSNAPRPSTYKVLVAKLKNGKTTEDRLDCFFQPEQDVTSVPEQRNAEQAAPPATETSAPAPATTTPSGTGGGDTPEAPAHVVEQPTPVAPQTTVPAPAPATTTPSGTGGGDTPSAPPELPECVNGGEKDENGKCVPPKETETPKPSKSPTPQPTQPPTTTPETPAPSTTRPPTTRPASKEPSRDPASQGNAGKGGGRNQDSGPGPVTATTTRPTSAATRTNPPAPTRQPTTSAPRVTSAPDPTTRATANTGSQSNNGQVTPDGDFG